MPKGDTYAIQTREIVGSIVAGKWIQGKSNLTPDSLKGETLNHRLQITSNAYGRDPKGSDLFGEELATIAGGLWGDELMSYSHCQHYYSALDSGLMFALFHQDPQRLEQVMSWEEGEHALEAALSAPPPSRAIVGPHGRCWIGPAGKGDADMRDIMRNRHAWLEGRLHTPPRHVDTDPAQTGLWVLMQLDQLAASKVPWAKPWPDLKKRISQARTFPPVVHEITIQRGPQGHVASLGDWSGLMHPAQWGCCDYREKTAVESYGCNPQWGRNEVPAPADAIPVPAVPGGGPIVITRIPAAHKPGPGRPPGGGPGGPPA